MPQRLVLLHGWGATAADLQPLGEQLAAQHPEPLDIVCLEAPEPHPQPGGRQWYGLFPSDWDAVPNAVQQLTTRLLGLSRDGIPLERTVLFGFSQGGAMALSCGCSLPLAGVISCSGYPHPDWQPPLDHLECTGRHNFIFTAVHGENGGMVERWLPIGMGVATATNDASEREAAAAAQGHRSTLGKAK